MAPDDGFRSFSHAIESDPLGVLLAKWQRDKFIGKLKQLPDVVEVIPSGSLTRGTQIGRIHDVDLIVVFDKDAHPDFGRGGPESAQAAMTYLQAKLLEKLHPLSDDLLPEGAREGLVKDTEQRVNSLRTRLAARNRATLAEIQGEIAGFSRGLDTVEANGTQLASRLHVNADTSWSGRAGTFPSGTAVVTSVVTLAGDGSALTVHNYFATNGQGRSFEVPFANLSGATPAPGLPTVVVLQLKTPGPCVTDQGEACPAASSYWVAFAAPADAAAFLKFVQDEIGGQ